MKKKVRIILMCIIICAIGIAQNRKPINKKVPATSATKKAKVIEYSKFSVKAGLATSVVYLARNIKDYNNEPGFCAGLVYRINNFTRISSLYTHYKPMDITPTWSGIKANTYELNAEILAHFPNKKTLLFPFAGLSLNTFKGFFTGQADYLNLREYYQINSTVKNNWIGLNLGTGLEHNFGLLGLFIDYRMRIGRQEKTVNIMDVCYTGGIKLNIPKDKIKFKKLSDMRKRYWL